MKNTFVDNINDIWIIIKQDNMIAWLNEGNIILYAAQNYNCVEERTEFGILNSILMNESLNLSCIIIRTVVVIGNQNEHFYTIWLGAQDSIKTSGRLVCSAKGWYTYRLRIHKNTYRLLSVIVVAGSVVITPYLLYQMVNLNFPTQCI